MRYLPLAETDRQDMLRAVGASSIFAVLKLSFGG